MSLEHYRVGSMIGWIYICWANAHTSSLPLRTYRHITQNESLVKAANYWRKGGNHVILKMMSFTVFKGVVIEEGHRKSCMWYFLKLFATTFEVVWSCRKKSTFSQQTCSLHEHVQLCSYKVVFASNFFGSFKIVVGKLGTPILEVVQLCKQIHFIRTEL